MHININKLQSDRAECIQNLDFLGDILQNYQYYAQQGKVNNSLANYQMEYNRNFDALDVIDKHLAQATGPAPIMRHTGIGNTKIGGVVVSKGGMLNKQHTGINRTSADEYSGIKKGSSSDEPEYVLPTNYRHQTQQKFEQQEEQVVPVVKQKYFVKENSINIVTKNGKYIATGLPDIKPISIVNVDKEYTTSEFFRSGKDDILYVKPEELIELPGLIGIHNLLDVPFSTMKFAPLNGTTIDAATMIFFKVRDILIEHVKFIKDNQGIIADDISDISGCLADGDLPSKDLVQFKRIWDNVKITETDGKYYLDRGGDYIYFNSTNLDTAMLINYIREGFSEPLWLKDDTYLSLFEAIKQCKPHGILEILGGVKFRYYTDKEVIKLIRM